MTDDRPLPKRGDRVRIRKGAYIKTTHPGGHRIAGRAYVVTLSHDSFPAHYETVAPGEIVVSWAGAGGYWCDAWEWDPIDE